MILLNLRKNIRLVFGFGALFIVLILACLPFFHEIPMSESVYFWNVVDTFKNAISVPWHPPLYPFMLFVFGKIFFGSFLGGYVLGIISLFLSGLLIYFLIKDRYTQINENSFFVFLLLINFFFLPVTMHGVFIFDIDNTILNPLLLCIFFIHLKTVKETTRKNIFLYLLLINISLWSKMTTPLILLCAIGFYHLIIKDFKFIFQRLLPLYVISIIIFYLGYGYIYTSFVLDGFGSFQFSAGKAIGLVKGQYTYAQSLKNLVFSIASNLGAIFIWSSPLFIFLIIYLIGGFLFRQKKEKVNYLRAKLLDKKYIAETISIIFILFLFLGYTFILKIQVSAGYPKYHYSLYSFLFLIIGLHYYQNDNSYKGKLINDEKFFSNQRIGFLVTFLMCLLWYIIGTDDILYKFYTLGREKKIFDLIDYFLTISIFLILPFVILDLLQRFRKKIHLEKNFFLDNLKYNYISIFLIILFGSNLTGYVKRVQANYSTNYHYGVQKTSEVVSFANSLPRMDSIYLPYAGFFIKKDVKQPHRVYGRIKNSDPFKPTTKYIIITDYLLFGNNYFFKSEYVQENYNRIKTIGSYGIWKRK